MFEQAFRSRTLRFYSDQVERMNKIMPKLLMNPAPLDAMVQRDSRLSSRQDALEQLELEHLEFACAAKILKFGQTIVMPSEQANVFQSVSRSYTESLEYRLPFEQVILQFTKPVDCMLGGQPDQLVAILLWQCVPSEEEYRDAIARTQTKKSLWQSRLTASRPPTPGESYLNTILPIFSDLNTRKITWYSDDEEAMFEQSSDNDLVDSWLAIKNLAIACIGYINCENIYLHKEEIPYKINRKRERQGKNVLEPYYVCRIRGVNYDSNGNATGEGTHHGHIYDVRGHFRKLPSGRTKWIRPHKRGLQSGGPYIPKTYVVAK